MKSIERAPYVGSHFPKDITKMIGDQSVTSVMGKIHEDYSYWDKVKYMDKPQYVSHKDLWWLTKVRRNASAHSIKIGNYQFKWNINNKIQEYLHFLDLNIGGTLESSSIITKEDKSRYLVSSIMEEAIASSQIEGAVTTRKKAKDMLRKNIKPRDKSEHMIVNNYITIQKILEIKSEKLNKQNLLSLHKLVSSNTMPNPIEEGSFRLDDDVKVIDSITGKVVHHPPKLEDIDILLNDLYTFFNDEKETVFIHPIIKASIIHFLIGFIHPFADGNGRTARALFYWYLLKKQYWLIEYMSISRLILVSKVQYARAFQYTEIDDNDVTYFILYSLRTMKLAFEDLRRYIQRKSDEKKLLSNFMGIDGINYRQAQILEWFSKEPELLITTKEAETRLAVSNQTVRLEIKYLVKRGYLKQIAIDKKTQGYIQGDNFVTLIKSIRQKNRNNKNTNNPDLMGNQPSLF